MINTLRRQMKQKIHSTAVIHPSAQIESGVEVAPYSVIGPEVKIGAGTFVGPHCVIECAEIGKNNVLTASVFIGMPPQDFSYKNEKTKVVIGDGNIIREGVSIHRGTSATGLTTLGDNCMLMANSHIGHDGRVGNGVVLVNSTGLSGHVEVEDKVIISGLVGVHQFVRIGEMAMVSGGAMVVMDVPPIAGHRATGQNL
ncbi:MAG: acyl-ACP--UDP-N-acetylglucosamine O-acyltransferase [Elusimicrobia bacterium]|nr:acyl-ACP--UDP-N-acetylglucosamine O-acyltransferase [Elusimicrobiota bacterium]